jgi:hypothetical protein
MHGCLLMLAEKAQLLLVQSNTVSKVSCMAQGSVE